VYVSAELLLVTWTQARFPDVRVATESPSDLQDVLPVALITRYGGSDVELTIDRPSVDVDVYAMTWAAAESLATEMRTAFRTELVGSLVAGAGWRAVVAKVRTLSGPARRPTSDPDLRRCGASYEFRIQSR
jgi:hypothetical protein